MCLTRPAFGVLVLGVLVAGVVVVPGELTGAEMTGVTAPPPFEADAVNGVDVGAVAAGVLEDPPPRAASACCSCEASPLSPPEARLLPMISAVAVLDDAITSRKRVPVMLPAVSISQRKARISADLLAALRAELRPRLVLGAAVLTGRGRVRALERQGLLDLAELEVEPLELRGLPGEHVHLHVVANRHLVEGAAQVGLHDRELLQQAIALRDQLAVLHGTAVLLSRLPIARGARELRRLDLWSLDLRRVEAHRRLWHLDSAGLLLRRGHQSPFP